MLFVSTMAQHGDALSSSSPARKAPAKGKGKKAVDSKKVAPDDDVDAAYLPLIDDDAAISGVDSNAPHNLALPVDVRFPSLSPLVMFSKALLNEAGEPPDAEGFDLGGLLEALLVSSPSKHCTTPHTTCFVLRGGCVCLCCQASEVYPLPNLQGEDTSHSWCVHYELPDMSAEKLSTPCDRVYLGGMMASIVWPQHGPSIGWVTSERTRAVLRVVGVRESVLHRVRFGTQSFAEVPYGFC